MLNVKTLSVDLIARVIPAGEAMVGFAQMLMSVTLTIRAGKISSVEIPQENLLVLVKVDGSLMKLELVHVKIKMNVLLESINVTNLRRVQTPMEATSVNAEMVSRTSVKFV
jgi:hypothetical protein